jgi:hypothetical protein
MRHLIALLFLVGCSDPASDAPDALRGTCGDAPAGQQWVAAEGCRLVCSRTVTGAIPQSCPEGDAGAIRCVPDNDPENCHGCGVSCRERCRSPDGTSPGGRCLATGCVCN